MRLAIVLLLASAAGAATVGRVAHPVGTTHSRLWTEPQYVFTGADANLPTGFSVDVSDGDVTISSTGEFPGAYELQLAVTFQWLPFPQWTWLRIPVTRQVEVLWAVYPEPDAPFFNGWPDDLVIQSP